MNRILSILALLALLLPAVCAAQAPDPDPVQPRILNLRLQDVPLSEALRHGLSKEEAALLPSQEGEPQVTLWVHYVPAERYVRVLMEAAEMKDSGPKGQGKGSPDIPGGQVLGLEDLKGFDRLIVGGRNVLAEAWKMAEHRLDSSNPDTVRYYRYRVDMAENETLGGTLGGRGFLGVRLAGKGYGDIETLNPEVRRAHEAWDGWGAFVREIIPNTPAADCGLEPGDVVVRINDMWVDSTCTLMRIVSRSQVGEAAVLEVLKNGEVTVLWSQFTDRLLFEDPAAQ